MTITSVKDQSPLLSMVGTQAASKADSAKNDLKFGDMMSKAQNGQAKTDIGKDDPQLKRQDTAKPDEKLKGGRKPDVKESAPDKKPEEAPKELSPEDAEKLEAAGQQVVSKIAEETDTDEEAVLEVMETLGLTTIQMLDPQNLGDVVLSLSEETDPMALVTNEELFTQVQDLTAAVDAIAEDLAEDMDIEFSDVSKLVEAATERPGLPSEMQMSVEADSETDPRIEGGTEKPEERITVNIKAGGKEARVETDEKGNVVKTESVAPREEAEARPRTKAPGERGEHEPHGEEHHAFGQTAAFTENLNIENNVQAPEIPQGEGYLSQQSREIMNQVTDGMRANLRPEMDELELNLHPASLGNVKINLVNKGGEITAEFKVQNELVRGVIESQLNDLKESLKDSGVKVEAVEVSVETQSFEQNLWQGGEQNGDSTSEQRQPGGRRIRRLNLDAAGGIEGLGEDLTDEEALAAEMMTANGNTVDYTA